MSEMLSNLVSGGIGALVAAVVSLVFSNKSQRNLVRIGEVRNELEDAYGPIYTMVSQPETIMTIGNNEEKRVPITLAQKKRARQNNYYPTACLSKQNYSILAGKSINTNPKHDQR